LEGGISLLAPRLSSLWRETVPTCRLSLPGVGLYSTPSSPIVNLEYMVKEITLGKPPPLSAPIRVSVPYQSVLKQVHYVLCDPTVAFIILPSPYQVRYYVGQAPQCLAVPWLAHVGGGGSFPLEQLHSTPSLILIQLFPTCAL